MKKIFVLTAVSLLLCSYNSFAGMNCATKYHKIRARVFNQDIRTNKKHRYMGGFSMPKDFAMKARQRQKKRP